MRFITRILHPHFVNFYMELNGECTPAKKMYNLLLKKTIHHQNWNSLTRPEILNLFKETFDGVRVLPDNKIALELRALHSGTLLCLENRSGSTIYKIGQTGNVYQVFTQGAVQYDDYEEYQLADETDELLMIY
ncbi:MAG: hypothetical protein ABJA79_07285 [Parafilimonas sp.]